MDTRPPIAAVVAALLAAAALVAAGCGGSSDTATVKKTATDFYNALRAGDGSKACSLLTPEEAQSLPGAGGAGGAPPSCAAGISAIGQGLPAATLKSAKVNGSDATVMLDAQAGIPITVKLHKTDKGWRVASFS
jgi:hypothetical protein